MKLLLCLDCSDIFLLKKQQRQCECGKSKGRYVDNLNAEISGNSVPIGFANKSLISALKNQIIQNKNKNYSRNGQTFEAFIIPDWAKSIKRV